MPRTRPVLTLAPNSAASRIMSVMRSTAASRTACVRVREVQVVGREDLPGRDARHLEAGRGEAALHLRHVDLGGVPQRQFHAVVAERGAAIYPPVIRL